MHHIGNAILGDCATYVLTYNTNGICGMCILGMLTTKNTDLVRKNVRPDRAHATPLAIYKDSSIVDHQPDTLKTDLNSWRTLGARAERNKENSAIPTKWTTYKVPQRPGSITGGAAASACIEVFVDEECEEMHKKNDEGVNASILQLRHGDGRDLKKETELLRENPLRNFPSNSLPR
uniref:Uncharacterized protein n=1 Tax=Fagus sylvatica TaxID=28930 RepID=A0A2N9HAX9_FAGSY